MQALTRGNVSAGKAAQEGKRGSKVGPLPLRELYSHAESCALTHGLPRPGRVLQDILKITCSSEPFTI